nr:hypothetical protein CTI12_AA187700 [Tanacetum cinerariifolium]
MESRGRFWKPMECVRKCWKARKVIEALRSSRSLPEECRIVHQCSSKADLVETKCRTKDPCRDKSVSKWYQRRSIRDDARQHPKKRGTSKDVVTSLDKRVAGIETSMAELKNQVEGLEGLGSDFESMREDFRVAFNTLSGDLKHEIHDLRDSFMGEIAKIREEFGEEVSTLHQTIEDLQ